MKDIKENQEKATNNLQVNQKKEKILLAILPYWDPMIPPMGITTLKAFLQQYGYPVTTVDLIVKNESLEFYQNYFDTLKECIPEEKHGNFNNIGHDVLQNHMMAFQHYTDENKYRELVKVLIYKSYYVEVQNSYIIRLNKIMEEFYSMLKEYFLQLLETEKPDVLGVTAYKCTVPASLFVLKLAKEKYPHIKTLMGGGTFNETHAPDSPNFKALLDVSESYLDKIILGPGELLFLKYLKGELPDNKKVYTQEDIDGKILQFPDMKIPDFSDLDMSKYPCLSATASFSCPYQCSFCVSSKVSGPYRSKDPKQTVNEMIQMYRQYKKQLFFMTDSLLNPVATEMANEFIQSGVSLYYDAYFRVHDDAGDIRNTMLWRKGGLYRIRLGTESGSERILKIMDKRITVNQIKASITAFAHAGIKTTTYWVIGHPEETEEDFQQTLDLITELKDDIFQAECNYFLVHYSKQASEEEWKKNIQLLYPEDDTNMLVFQFYTPSANMKPSREETFRRVHRFEHHCRKLGIPNPYSYQEHVKADERWKRLHQHAVPPLMEFMKQNQYINENLSIKIPTMSKNVRIDNDEFDF